MDGQLSIFDLPGFIPEKEEKQDTTTRELVDRELLYGTGFENGKKRVYEFFKEEPDATKRQAFLKREYGIGGWSIPEGIVNVGSNGIDINIREKPIGKVQEIHIGWMMVEKYIAELISKGKYYQESPAEEYYRDTGRTDFWQQSEGKPYQFWKTECQFSGHTCNKEELWKIAKEFDDITCPEKCCRSCDQNLCGARCNGSEEPPKCKQADKCEAYETKGCGGTVEPCRFGGPFNWSARSAYAIFHEHCTHRGWHRQADEEKGITASWMCGYPEGKPARGWEDWVECTEENCWLLKKGEE